VKMHVCIGPQPAGGSRYGTATIAHRH
jgi:hypothetical protein